MMGEDWTFWHSIEHSCKGCCKCYSEDDDHQNIAGFYDEDGIMDYGAHVYFDLNEPNENEIVEWSDNDQSE